MRTIPRGAPSQEKRAQMWQFCTDKHCLRLGLQITSPVSDGNVSQLHHTLHESLVAAGLPLAQSLEKRPRPMLYLGYPLPVGVPGWEEWADAIIDKPLPWEDPLAHLGAHMAPGLAIHRLQLLPSHATHALDLATEAHWCWEAGHYPLAMQERFQQKLNAFLAAEHFVIAKMGKNEGHKVMKEREVRSVVLSGHWEQQRFYFQTRLQQGEALNPTKLLGGVLDMPPADIRGLTRIKVVLQADERLQASDPYETKLHNMYEDAVLLSASQPSLAVIDDDDDLLMDQQ